MENYILEVFSEKPAAVKYGGAFGTAAGAGAW